MASGGPPDTLNGKHLQMALMVAAGWTNKRIAQVLGTNEVRVGVIKQSPLFAAQVVAHQREFANLTLTQLADRIAAESGRTLDVIVGLRDTAENESVRLGAARELFDRQSPKVTRTESDATLKILFDGETLRRMFGAYSEVVPRAIGAHSTATATAPPTRGACLAAVPVEDFVAGEHDGTPYRRRGDEGG